MKRALKESAGRIKGSRLEKAKCPAIAGSHGSTGLEREETAEEGQGGRSPTAKLLPKRQVWE